MVYYLSQGYLKEKNTTNMAESKKPDSPKQRHGYYRPSILRSESPKGGASAEDDLCEKRII